MNSEWLTAESVNRGTFHDAVQSRGFALVSECLSVSEIESLRAEFPATAPQQRNLFSRESIRRLATSQSIRDLAESVLGPSCFAVRAIFFNKTPEANWKVAWHQDLTIAVREKCETAGFSSWSVKHGVPHVQPPASILERVLAIRLHLDDNEDDNGPLRCIPGSHRFGRLTNDEIRDLDKSHSVTCHARTGSVLLMRPLVAHASSSCTSVRPRRVVHIEFANVELPNGLEWNERV
jgi:ectoine hydroxylase-related dioxygenase (phytanoyl-CoA dioxygenase family)